MAQIEQAGAFDSPTFASLSESERLLKAAESLEIKPTEQTQLASLKQRIVDARKNLQAQLDQAFLAELAQLEQRYESLTKSLETGADALTAVNKLGADLRELRGRSGQITPTLTAKLDVLSTQQSRLTREAGERVERAQAVARVAEAIPNLANYRAALANYAQRYSGTPRATQFLLADQESPQWQALERWNQFADRVQGVSLTRIKPDEAGKLLADVKRLQGDETTARLPGVEVIASHVAYLESISARTTDPRALTQKLFAMLNEPAITSLRTVQVTQPAGGVKRYYLLDPPSVSGTQVTLRIASGFDLMRSNKIVQLEQIVKSGTALDVVPGHVALGQRLQQILTTDLATKGWETAFLDALEAIQTATDVEPLVQLLFLERTLDAASKGSTILARALRPVRDPITAAEIQLTANWLNPDDQSASLERQKTISLWQRLPPVAELRMGVNAELAAIDQTKFDRYTWVGCLLKDDNPAATWRCATRLQNNASGDLVVILRDAGDEKIMIERIGKLQGGAAVLDTAKTRALSEGRAVYMVAKS